MLRRQFTNGDGCNITLAFMALLTKNIKMARSRFNPQGDHSANINRYLLAKAQAAKQENISPLQADFAWKTFLAEQPDLIEAIARDHPGTAEDSTIRVRENFIRQTNRFITWLRTAAGRHLVKSCCYCI